MVQVSLTESSGWNVARRSCNGWAPRCKRLWRRPKTLVHMMEQSFYIISYHFIFYIIILYLCFHIYFYKVYILILILCLFPFCVQVHVHFYTYFSSSVSQSASGLISSIKCVHSVYRHIREFGDWCGAGAACARQGEKDVPWAGSGLVAVQSSIKTGGAFGEKIGWQVSELSETAPAPKQADEVLSGGCIIHYKNARAKNKRVVFGPAIHKKSLVAISSSRQSISFGWPLILFVAANLSQLKAYTNKLKVLLSSLSQEARVWRPWYVLVSNTSKSSKETLRTGNGLLDHLYSFVASIYFNMIVAAYFVFKRSSELDVCKPGQNRWKHDQTWQHVWLWRCAKSSFWRRLRVLYDDSLPGGWTASSGCTSRRRSKRDLQAGNTCLNLMVSKIGGSRLLWYLWFWDVLMFWALSGAAGDFEYLL